MIKNRILNLVLLLAVSSLVFTSCGDDEETPVANFLASNVDALGTVDLGNFTIPSNYDLSGDLGPGVYSGQERRLAQLKEIVDSSRNEPIYWDLEAALINENEDKFASPAAQGSSNLRTKIDELNFDNGNTSVADAFGDLAETFVTSSQANYTTTAADGTAGMITTGTKKRHVSAKGLEYIQILEKGLYGAIFYDQMVDDYLRPTQAGADNENGNNESAAGSGYTTKGTDRQHRWDEVFGYLGANPLTYPNTANTSNGDGQFIANYLFDFSDEIETVFGVNPAQKLMDAFVFGRSVLKAGEGFGEADETTNETYYEAARKDVKLYTETGIVAAAFHYLNSAIADVTDEDKLHHLSEALAFIYSLSFNSEGIVSADDAFDALEALGWKANDRSLNGIYDINLWTVTDTQLQAAKDILNKKFPGFGDLPL